MSIFSFEILVVINKPTPTSTKYQWTRHSSNNNNIRNIMVIMSFLRHDQSFAEK